MSHRILLYPMVFISGASVLAVEILGTRVLGPFYGVSLFLWSALITVTLIALSVGYMLGGRWADRGTRFSRLCYLMIGAGIWLLLIPWLKHPLLDLGETFGLRFAVLIAAFVLFAPPLTLLGMISPYAIRLRAERLEEVGRTAGDLYAISTIGSVIAALLTGFVLIPSIGVARLILLIGLLLLFSGAVGLLTQRGAAGKTMLMLALALLAGTLAVWRQVGVNSDPDSGLLTVRQSAYAEIRVLDRDGYRYLFLDGGTHTIADTRTWGSLFPYVALVNLTRDFFPAPGEMLLVGLGGGTLMKNFARNGWAVEAVEIDPVVTEVARTYFGLTPQEGPVYHTDGRQFLNSREKRYDLIVMDAFGSSSIPFHLVTQEAFELLAARLKPNGVLAMNIETNGWHSLLVRSLGATLGSVFSEVLALPGYARDESRGNLVLLAAQHPLMPVEKENVPLDYFGQEGYWREFAWENRFAPETGNAPVLSDDLNPVELWAERINLRARKELHQYFDQGKSW